MRSWASPTAEDLERVAVMSARAENRAYFFDRLENPTWVAALADRGFFASPPSPVPSGDPGHIRFPPWPEGRYLARVASQAPADVSAVLATIPVGENPVVARLIFEAAARLPDDQLTAMASMLQRWAVAHFADHFADEAVAVVVRLLGAGEEAGALQIARSLLEVQPDPRRAAKSLQGDSALRLHPEAVGRLSHWQYERVLEQVLSPLIDKTGLGAVRLFADLLDDALRLSRWDDEGPVVDDFSYIWRPAVENHEQNGDHDLRGLLVSAARDSALAFAREGEEELQDVVVELERRSTIHNRIALFIFGRSHYRI
jgi:hypothetical protein